MWIFLLGYILQNYIFILYEGDFILLLHQSFEIKKNVTLYLKEYQFITLLGLTASKTDNNEENL